ncbi:uncharacterized protein Tco025E_05680 [Trypanosoma conorhini]|uniref:Arrestin-like N-terminal domain-containing protein n=1 Tax=Trypanosoma conorhini TaxID=83891 RepID=A0A3R7RX47_9TRYP|nr:uncharacterized protein Tco025E_05680 [Trypanosoma conorhini]RNF14924.1 hypothetical protein Tco025E_05680 [Trypanosoma conorhini]
MGIFGRDNVEVRLRLHSENAEYLPGGLLSGVIEVSVKKETASRAIRLRIRGEEYAKVNSGRLVQHSTRVHYDKVYTFAGDATKNYTPDRTLILIADLSEDEGADACEPEVLMPGTHNYPFELRLPMFLPPSFDTRSRFDISEARMSYTAKVYVDIPRGFDVKCVRNFYVLSAISAAQRRQRLEEHGKEALVSLAQLHKFFCLGRFWFPKAGQFIATEATIEPTVVVMDEYTSTASSDADNNAMDAPDNSNAIKVHVKVRNDSRKTLNSVRVQITNHIEVNPGGVLYVRHVKVGEPFVSSEPIYPGEEKSFLACFRPPPFISYSSLEFQENDPVDLYRYNISPLIPLRKQKQYVVYEQPLMSMRTAFVDSRCVVSVDFPGVKAKGTLEADNVLILAGTVDEQNRTEKVPSVYDSAPLARETSPNSAHTKQSDTDNYAKGPERTRYKYPMRHGRVQDPTGIFPAYTAGNWKPTKEELS